MLAEWAAAAEASEEEEGSQDAAQEDAGQQDLAQMWAQAADPAPDAGLLEAPVHACLGFRVLFFEECKRLCRHVWSMLRFRVEFSGI